MVLHLCGPINEMAQAIPMADATSFSCAKALVKGWVSHFRVPDDLTSYGGPAFISDLWATWAPTQQLTT